jgi:CRP-like cAMP-binding protein
MVTPTPSIDGRSLLARIAIFDGLSRRELDLLHALTGTKRLREREVLFRKGDAGSALYAVLAGRLRVYSAGGDAKELVFRMLEPGDVFGEVALFGNQLRSATVDALEPSLLLTLQRRDLLPFLEQHPKVTIKLASMLARWVRELSERIEDAVLLTIPARLAKQLLSLRQSHGKPDGVTGVRIDMRLSQSQLGEMVGATRESINKQMRLWTEAGAIKVDRGFITVLNERAIAETAGFAVL